MFRATCIFFLNKIKYVDFYFIRFEIVGGIT